MLLLWSIAWVGLSPLTLAVFEGKILEASISGGRRLMCSFGVSISHARCERAAGR